MLPGPRRSAYAGSIPSQTGTPGFSGMPDFIPRETLAPRCSLAGRCLLPFVALPRGGTACLAGMVNERLKAERPHR
jgi:hypothetical protein